MTIVYFIVGAIALTWGLPKFFRSLKARREPPGGRRIGWKIDKKTQKAYGLYLVDGKVVERGEEDIILDNG